MTATAKPLVSLIVPCYNEEDVLAATFSRLLATAETLSEAYSFEFIFINDGSSDATPEVLDGLAGHDPRIKVLHFSRNFGHQQALTAGFDVCAGDYAITLDADLQDPPEKVPDILAQLEAGYDLVHMVRSDRQVDSYGKRTTARAYYWMMQKFVLPEIPMDSGDFKGCNRAVIEVVRHYREQIRFMRGIFAWLGFRSTTLPYVREARSAGKAKYNWWRALRLATDGVLSYSLFPLRLFFIFGVTTWLALIFYICLRLGLQHFIAFRVKGDHLLLVSLVAGFSGLILMGLGIVGEYLGRIFREVKGRPLYIVRTVRNMDRRVPFIGPATFREPSPGDYEGSGPPR